MAEQDSRSTAPRFEPYRPRGLAKPNSVELMLMVTGVAICAIPGWGVFVGAPIALAALYSAFFVAPKIQRGLYIGPCPHCGAEMSATHYQEELRCPSCDGLVRVRNGRYEAGRG